MTVAESFARDARARELYEKNAEWNRQYGPNAGRHAELDAFERGDWRRPGTPVAPPAPSRPVAAVEAAPEGWTQNGRPVPWQRVRIGAWRPSGPLDGIPVQQADGTWMMRAKIGGCTTTWTGVPARADCERVLARSIARWERTVEGAIAAREDGQSDAHRVTSRGRIEYR